MIMIGFTNVRNTEKKKTKDVSYMFSMMKLSYKLREKIIVYLEKVTEQTGSRSVHFIRGYKFTTGGGGGGF